MTVMNQLQIFLIAFLYTEGVGSQNSLVKSMKVELILFTAKWCCIPPPQHLLWHPLLGYRPYVRGKKSICTHFYKVFYSPQPAWVYSQITHNTALCWGQEYHGNDRSCQTTEETPEFNTYDPLLSSILRLQICSFALQEGIHIMFCLDSMLCRPLAKPHWRTVFWGLGFGVLLVIEILIYGLSLNPLNC